MAVGIRRMYFINEDVSDNDTTPVSTGIIIPVQPGQTLLFNGQLRGISGNTTSAWGFFCTCPDAFVDIAMTQIGADNNGGTIDALPLGVDSTDITIFSSGIEGNKLFGITGSIFNSPSAVNFELFMVKNNANSGNFYLLKNSFIEITVV